LPAQPSTPFDTGLVPSLGLTGVLQGSEVGTGEIEALGMELGELSPELALACCVRPQQSHSVRQCGLGLDAWVQDHGRTDWQTD